MDVDLSHDSRLAAFATLEGEFGVYDTQRRQKMWRCNHFARECVRIAFSPDGRLLAAVEPQPKLRRSKPFRIRVRSARAGEIVHVLDGHEDPIKDVLFSGDESVYSWDCQGHTVKWNYRSGRKVWEFSTTKWKTRHADPGHSGRRG